MNILIKLSLCVAVSGLVGCASTVNRGNASMNEKSQVREESIQVISFKPLRALTVGLDSAAAAKMADNQDFSVDKLFEKINSTLSTARYLQAQNNSSNLRMDVVITNIRVRSGVSAIMFGILAGADSITGQVSVKDGDKVIDKFEVDISYAFGGAMGITSARMDWMYESFSNKILEEMKKVMPMSK